ncbi:MAG: response regulator [Nitrospirae bacterium]|nr:response regulator [Nitrospirota bacterium]
MTTPHVLIVDDEPAVGALLAEAVTGAGYATAVVSDGSTALDRIRSGQFALVLSDIRMPGFDGIELLRRIKAHAPEIEVVMITASSDIERAREMIRLGASDYLIKPFKLDDVRTSVKRAVEKYQGWQTTITRQHDMENQIALQKRQIKEHLLTAQEKCVQLRGTVDALRETYDATLESLIVALDYRDREPAGHAQRVAVFAEEIAKTLAVSGPELDAIRRGALLHDMGKIGVADAILNKVGALAEAEWDDVKKHVQYGYRMIKSIPFLRDAAQIVLHHHERYDGTGYPGRVAGDAIVMGARIFAVADTFEAMTSERPYRPLSTYAGVCAELARCAGAQFDPLVVEAFMRIPETTWKELRRAVDLATRHWKNETGL